MEAEIVLFLAGDVVVCHACRLDLVRITGPDFVGCEFLPAARPVGGDGDGQLYCMCGAGAVLPYATGLAAEAGHLGPRILVRSGTWTGWRALGGE